MSYIFGKSRVGSTLFCLLLLVGLNAVGQPTVTISSAVSSPTNLSTIPVTIVFSSDVTGFDASDLVLANAAVSNFAGGPNTYTCDLTSPVYGTITLSVPANSTPENNLASNIFTITYDNAAPSLLSSTISSNNANTTLAKVSDVVTLTFETTETVQTPTVSILGHAVVPTNTSGNSWSASYTLLAGDTEGSIPFTIDFSDLAGNSGVQVTSTSDLTSVTFDTTTPTLTSVGIASNNANTALAKVGDTITLTFEASETVLTPTATIQGNAATILNTSGNIWTATYTLQASDPEGGITFTIDFSDLAGNSGVQVTTTNPASAVTFDKTAPTAVISQVGANPTNVSPLAFSIVFSEAVTGFDQTDLTLSNATVTSFTTLDNVTFSVSLTPIAEGAVGISLASGVAFDASGNGNAANAGVLATYDITGPTATISNITPSPTNNSTIQVSILFSEEVTGFDQSDLTITNATVSSFSTLDNITFTVDLSAIGEGTVATSVGAGLAFDLAGNGNLASNIKNVLYDVTNPAVTISTYLSNNANTALAKVGEVVTVNFTSTENLATPVVTISGQPVIPTSGDQISWVANYTMQVTDVEGLVPFTVNYTDLAGNVGAAVTQATAPTTITFDRTTPTLSAVSILSNNANSSLAKPADIITLSFTATEILTATPAVTVFGNAAVVSTADNIHFTATYTLTGSEANGIVPFTIDFADLAGNVGLQANATTNASQVTFDKTKPTITSVQRISNTSVKVFLSELAQASTITKANSGGFVVTKTGGGATYTVNSIAPGTTNGEVVLTVSTISGAAANGITVTYVQGGNGTVADVAGNLMDNDAVGVSAPAWQLDYYSKAAGNLELLGTWGLNADGSGVNPTNFTQENQIFHIQNASKTVGAAWTVSGEDSKAVVEATWTFTIPSGSAYTGVVDVRNTGTLLLQNTTLPTLGVLEANSTVNYGQTVAANVSAATYGNLEISGADVNKSILGDITVQGKLTITRGILFFGATAKNATVFGDLVQGGTNTRTIDMTGGVNHNLYLGGANNSINALTTAANFGTVYYNRSGDQQVFTSANYRNLEIAGSGIKTVQGNITVNNNLTISGGTLSAGSTAARTITVAGNLSGVGGIDISGGSFAHLLNLNGLNNAIGSFNGGTASTVTYNGVTLQQVMAVTYNNLVINSSNNTNTRVLQGNTTVNGNLTITRGILDFGGVSRTLTIKGNLVDGANTRELRMSSGSGHKLYLEGTNNAINLFSYEATSEVHYSGTAAQNMLNNAHPNVFVEGGSVKTLGGSITIAGNLTLSSGTLAFGGSLKTLTISGDLSGAGTIDMSTAFAHVLSLQGNSNSFGAITSSATAVVDYARATGSQDIYPYTYTNLRVSGTNIKKLTGATSVSGTLNMNSAVVELGNFDLTINQGGTITGAGSATNMISCDATGKLIKYGNSAAEFVNTYPVGTGIGPSFAYTPFVISSLTATVDPGAYISIQPIEGRNSHVLPFNDALLKYWVVDAQGISGINANIAITYKNPEEVPSGAYQTLFEPKYWDGTDWQIPAGSSGPGINPMSSTGSSILSGEWTAIDPTIRRTYYSYQTGSWENSTTWTKDPSGTLWDNPSNIVPSPTDNVIILNGRKVTANSSKSISSVTINAGGTLDILATTGNDFHVVRGQGILKLSSATLPVGDYTNFVSSTGGTVEYYGMGGFTFTQLEYNNLVINLNNSTDVSLTTSDITMHGSLNLKKGKFQINDATDRRLKVVVEGSVVVESTAGISVGTGNTAGVYDIMNARPAIGLFHTNTTHIMEVSGDFTNRGVVQMTNQVRPNYSQFSYTGAVTLWLKGFSDNKMTLENTTNLYNLIVDKGSDQTFVYEINSTNTNNFKLFGPNNSSRYDVAPFSGDNPEIRKALWIKNGTLKLTGSILIPSLSEGRSEADANGGNGDYAIGSNAALWIASPDVTVYSTVTAATRPYDADGIQDGSGHQALSLYGTFRISEGFFGTRNSAGFIFWNTTNSNAVVVVEGGTVNASIFRSANGTSGRTSYTQSGGTVIVRGNETEPGELAAYPIFGIMEVQSGFTMTGGEILLRDVNSGGTGGNGFYINSDPGNYNVTGGKITIELNPANSPNFDLNTKANIYNLEIKRLSGAGTPNIRLVRPLVVTNDLSIRANSQLNSTDGVTVNNLSVGHDFALDAGGFYVPNTNTTEFNGSAGQQFLNLGTITGDLYNLSITGQSNTVISSQIRILNDLYIDDNSIFNDGGKSVYVRRYISNSGQHTGQPAGGIILENTAAQVISGNGTGIFNNLSTNKTAGSVTMNADFELTGNLRLANTAAVVNIGSNLLKFSPTSNVYDALAGIGQTFSATKMILTGGNQSDRGVTKTCAATGSFLFPVGTTKGYTPATFTINTAPTGYGDVNMRPVTVKQPFVTSANSLSYYWKVSQTGFTGLSATAINWDFKYINTDVVGTEASYIPGVYNPINWQFINNPAQVNDALDEIHFTSIGTIEGDFTAGEPGAFGAVSAFFSRQSGNWATGGPGAYTTWTNDTIANLPTTTLPSVNNPVVIRNNHTVTIPATDVTAKTVGSMKLMELGVLDLTTTIGHNFGALPNSKIGGNGTIRISSSAATAEFPSGDFGGFLGANGGTVEFYTSGTSFAVPLTTASGNSLGNYYNLYFTTSTPQTITMAAQNILVYNNLTSKSTSTGITNFGNSATVDIRGNLVVDGGTIQFPNAGTNTVTVSGDVNITAAGSKLSVLTGGASSHTLSIAGNLLNNGTLDMLPGGSLCDVLFTGATNKSISGSGTTAKFNKLTVDKGGSTDYILNVTAQTLTLNVALGQALFLTSGTFRVDNPTLDFSLSTTSTFTIPANGRLSVNQGNVRIGNGNNNAGDLMLSGKIQVSGGNVYVGSTALGNFNNDIEYSSAGLPEIEITGGNLVVNGQIRRGTTTTLGSLVYKQSGGSVTIHGLNQQTNRAKLEITNDGSYFQMAGGSMTIVRGNGLTTAYNDLYLRPTTYSVTGGTINLGSTLTPAANIFSVNATAPVWNLVVDATTQTKTAKLAVNPLVVLNDLTINGSSVFDANQFDVYIGGSLNNYNPDNSVGINIGGFRSGSNTQKVVFNASSGSQNIRGTAGNVTNFANLEINSGSVVTLAANSNIRTNRHLIITRGVIDNGLSDIYAIDDVENYGEHRSTGDATKALILMGGSKQYFYGGKNPLFGNITISNTANVEATDSLQVNGVLKFTAGYLFIDGSLLTLGVNSSISGSFDYTKMIRTNGVLSDAGVRKYFASGTSTFTYPFGISGKYTPATITVTGNTTLGYITVKPINSKHPTIQDGVTNELAYYWSVVSSGLTYTSASQTFSYLQEDVSPDENLYLVGRYVNGNWAPAGGLIPAEGNVNAVGNTINVTNVSYIDGEYTAGETSNFGDKPVYYSRNATLGGTWSGATTWSIDPVLKHNGAATATPPYGNPMVIAAGHTVTVTADAAYAYSIDLAGNLNLGSTVAHNFGHVGGGGKISMQATAAGAFVFPGGYYIDFFNNSDAIVEYIGAGTLPIIKTYPNLLFSAAGTKEMSNVDLLVKGNLTIAGGTLDNTGYSREITLYGNWVNNSGGSFLCGSGQVTLIGATNQTLSAPAAGEKFYNFQIDKVAGTSATLSGNFEVTNKLLLSVGYIKTSTGNVLYLSNISTSCVTGGSTTSFVDGPMKKLVANSSSFNFPVGKLNRYGLLGLLSTTTSGNQIWQAEYFNSPYSDLDIRLPLSVVSDNEYWKVDDPAGGLANLRLRWDSPNSIVPASATTRQKLRVAEFDGAATEWFKVGEKVTDGGFTSGTVETTTKRNLDSHLYTLAAESLPTATIAAATTSICSGSTATVVVSFTGVAPWNFTYTVNGANAKTITNVGSTPYNIVLSYEDLLAMGGSIGNYVIRISAVSDATGAAGVSNFTQSATITLLESANPVISGKAAVVTNEAGVVYSTPSVAGHTYSWSISGLGTVVGASNLSTYTINWGALTGTSTLTLTETVTATGCSKTTTFDVQVSDIPAPLVTGKSPVCSGEVVVYSTPASATHTFDWTIVGGVPSTATSGVGVNTITVTWGPAGAGSVTVKETTATNNASNTLPVTVFPLPIATHAVSDATICSGETANIVITTPEAGISYHLYDKATDLPVGGSVSSGLGGVDVTLPVSPTTTTVYYIIATTENLCGVRILDESTVTVNSNPIAVWVGFTDNTCAGNLGETWSVTTLAGHTYTWSIESAVGTVASGQGTSSITIDWGSNATIMGGNTQIVKKVTVVVKNNATSCTQTLDYSVIINRKPDSGPIYHISNSIAL